MKFGHSGPNKFTVLLRQSMTNIKLLLCCCSLRQYQGWGIYEFQNGRERKRGKENKRSGENPPSNLNINIYLEVLPGHSAAEVLHDDPVVRAGGRAVFVQPDWSSAVAATTAAPAPPAARP